MKSQNFRQVAAFINDHPYERYCVDEHGLDVLRFFLKYKAPQLVEYHAVKRHSRLPMYVIREDSWPDSDSSGSYHVPTWVLDVFKTKDPIWISIPPERIRVRGILGQGALIKRKPPAKIYFIE